LSRSSIFITGKNPRSIAADTPAVFPHDESRIPTQSPLSRDGWGFAGLTR
jgi:hypothetical protein